jgi:hypothetical protein
MVFVRFQIILILLSVYTLAVRPAPYLPLPISASDPPSPVRLLCDPLRLAPSTSPSGPLHLASSTPPPRPAPSVWPRLPPLWRPPFGPVSPAVVLRQPPPSGPVSSQLTTINSFRYLSPSAFLL